ncbi:MAG: phosphatidate cytidylyltransferase [Gemmatimonadales bacterium]
MDNNLVRRILFAVVAIPLALLLVWAGGWPLALLVATIAVLGTRELFDIAEKQSVRPLRGLGLVLAAAGPLLVYASITRPDVHLWLAESWTYLGAAVVLVLLAEALRNRLPSERPLGAVAITGFAVAYSGLLPSFLIGIRHGRFGMLSWAGTAMVFFPLVVTWVCDSAAMFGGRAFGGPKMAPTISPGKTRSGGVAGLVGGVLIAPLFVYLVFPRVGIEIAILPAAAMALALSVVGQLGDLAESLFKREAGVKDSSTLIPGHGGVLDRFDSLYVILPTAAFCYHLLGML